MFLVVCGDIDLLFEVTKHISGQYSRFHLVEQKLLLFFLPEIQRGELFISFLVIFYFIYFYY